MLTQGWGSTKGHSLKCGTASSKEARCSLRGAFFESFGIQKTVLAQARHWAGPLKTQTGTRLPRLQRLDSSEKQSAAHVDPLRLPLLHMASAQTCQCRHSRGHGLCLSGLQRVGRQGLWETVVRWKNRLDAKITRHSLTSVLHFSYVSSLASSLL